MEHLAFIESFPSIINASAVANFSSIHFPLSMFSTWLVMSQLRLSVRSHIIQILVVEFSTFGIINLKVKIRSRKYLSTHWMATTGVAVFFPNVASPMIVTKSVFQRFIDTSVAIPIIQSWYIESNLLISYASPIVNAVTATIGFIASRPRWLASATDATFAVNDFSHISHA